MFKKLAILLFTSLLTGCFAMSPEVKEPAPESKLHEVVARFDEVNNPEKIQCRTYYIKCSAQLPNMQMQIQMETYTDLIKNRIRITVTVPGTLKQVELYDGKKGYSIIPGMQTKILSEDEVAFLRYSAKHTNPWANLSNGYEKIMMDNNTHVINGKTCYRLVAQPLGEPTLSPEEIFIDQKTFYPVRIRSIITTDLGKVPNQIDFIRFRKYEGALIGQTLKVQQLNMTLPTELQELKVNCPIPDDIFDAEKIADEED